MAAILLLPGNAVTESNNEHVVTRDIGGGTVGTPNIMSNSNYVLDYINNIIIIKYV